MVRALSALGALAALLPLFFQARPIIGAPVSQLVDPTNLQDLEASGNAPSGIPLLATILGLESNGGGQPQPSPLSPGDAGNSEDKGKGKKGKGKGKHGGKKGGKKMGNGNNSTVNANAKAVYFITNDATNGNAIVAMKVGADGQLSDGSVTKTGGKGGVGIEKGAPAAADALFSQ